VLTGFVTELTRKDLVSAITGRGLTRLPERKRERVAPTMLEVNGLVAPGIGPISLVAHAGEIVGIFGLIGSGRTELLTALFGARRVRAGEISIAGRRVSVRSPADAVSVGMALVPSDRRRQGIFSDLSAQENMILRGFGRLARFGVRRFTKERQLFQVLAERVDLQPRRSTLPARSFSGGNQQKLVLGRWLQEGEQCRVLLLDEPTQGVDVGARTDLYEAMRAFTSSGAAVLVTSSEPEELTLVAHRVIVLSRGRAVGTLSRGEVSERRLLELAHLGEIESE